jgi:hypothetical protein
MKQSRVSLACMVSLLFVQGAFAQNSVAPSPAGSAPAPTPAPKPAGKPASKSAPEPAAKSQAEPKPAAPAPAKVPALTPAAALENELLSKVKNPLAGKATAAGVVVDSSGAFIAGAKLVLTRQGQEHKRFETSTDEEGFFQFENVQAGSWSLTVSSKDKLAQTVKLTLKAGEIKTNRFSLEELESVDTLRVTGKRTYIHPDNIGNETNLDHKFIYQYKSGNDLKELITSTPGIMNDSFGNIITRGEHNSINYEVDGAVIPEAAGVLQQSQPISPRSMQSMAVDIGGYEAQDGGGPLGAVAHIRSLPILAKPNLNVGQQIGGPMAGSIYYNGSTALSQNPNSKLFNLRVESSGSFRGTSYKLAPPVKNYVNNNAADINSFTKIEYRPNENNIFRVTAAINETFTQLPTSIGTRNAGFHGKQHDAQDYIMTSYIHKFKKYFDQLNLHMINGIYYEKFSTSWAFDPYPNFNNGQPLYSIATRANRTNYIFSAQGSITKNIKKEHHFKAGFLTELRPVRTNFNAIYYNADLVGSLQQQAAGQGLSDSTNQQINLANQLGDTDTANALLATLPINTNPFPYGAMISPFTGQLGGPQFMGPVGRFHGFRYLQSAYIQDKYTPQNGFWKRLTLDAGARFDLQRSFYGNTLPLASTIASIPGVQQFSLQPFLAQAKNDAQISGRYGASFVVAKNTVLRGSYSDLFMPNPVDFFITPFQVLNVGPTNGIGAYGVFDGTPRPLHATRGQLVDTGVETQLGRRFSTRTNLFYKYLTNFGDSGVVGNLPLYNRLTNSAQDAYGVETRMDMRSDKNGYGFNGFLSNTVQVAYLRESKQPTGGFFTNPEPPGNPGNKFPDHDRRFSSVAGVGYKTRQNIWSLLTVQALTGLQDERDQNLVGPHNARTRTQTLMSLSLGWQPSERVLKKCAYLPNAFDVRIDNLLNQRFPVNLGSPFQGTRYNLPIRVLAGCSWQLGPPEAKLSSKPAPNSIRATM